MSTITIEQINSLYKKVGLDPHKKEIVGNKLNVGTLNNSLVSKTASNNFSSNKTKLRFY